jgi:hypothetical protein
MSDRRSFWIGAGRFLGPAFILSYERDSLGCPLGKYAAFKGSTIWLDGNLCRTLFVKVAP